MGDHLDVLREIIMACPESIQQDAIFNMGLVLSDSAPVRWPKASTSENLLAALSEDEQQRNMTLGELLGSPASNWEDIEKAIGLHVRHGLSEGFLVISLLHMVDESFRHMADEAEHKAAMENHRSLVNSVTRKKQADSPENVALHEHLMQPSVDFLETADQRLLDNQEALRQWRSIAGERLTMDYPLGFWSDLVMKGFLDSR